jgi:xanthine dehydrogenase accessory factor
MQDALDAGRRAPTRCSLDLQAAYGMSCGGSVDVLIETFDAGRAVLIVGAGHVGTALAPLLVSVGFRVVVCDTRPARVEGGLLQPSSRLHLVAAPHDDAQVLAALGGRVDDAAAVVMTHDQELDERALAWALHKGFAFVGGVGSRGKAARLCSKWVQGGLSEAEVARVSMPLGVDIGARSPAEIGISIAGELIAWRAGGGGAARGHQV